MTICKVGLIFAVIAIDWARVMAIEEFSVDSACYCDDRHSGILHRAGSGLMGV